MYLSVIASTSKHWTSDESIKDSFNDEEIKEMKRKKRRRRGIS